MLPIAARSREANLPRGLVGEGRDGPIVFLCIIVNSKGSKIESCLSLVSREFYALKAKATYGSHTLHRLVTPCHCTVLLAP